MEITLGINFQKVKKKNQPYWIQYTDHLGKRRTQKGFTNKGLTEQLAAKLETEVMLRKCGLIDLEQESLANEKKKELAQLTELFRETPSERSEQNKLHKISRLQKFIDGCEFKVLSDIEAEAVTRFLKQLRKEKNLGARTYNHYLQAINSFFNCCIETRRLASNPLAGIERLNNDVDVRHKRRTLSEKEIEQLIQSALGSGCRIQAYSGEERAKVYLLSYMTGLRRKELGSLCKRSFDLSADPPTLTVEAKDLKHKKKDVLPLHPIIVLELQDWLEDL